jgi:hypothetical protein
MDAAEAAEAFKAGPVDLAGAYQNTRKVLDGPIGFIDGIASIAGAAGHVTSEVADIREDLARGQTAADDVRLSRKSEEQSLLLKLEQFARGDNLKQYYVVGAVAVAAIVLFKK